MKKALSFVLAMITFGSFAQLSVSIDNKYGFNMLGTYGWYGYGNVNSTNGATMVESKKFCFGNGYQGGIGLRYGLKKGFGIDLGFGYLLGMTSKTSYQSNSGGLYPYINDNTDEVKARIFRTTLGLSYVGQEKLSPMIKVGLILGMGHVNYYSKSVQTSTQYSYNPNPPYNSYTVTSTSTDVYESKYYGGLSLGFNSAIGINYRIKETISLSLCLDIVVQDFTPKKGKLLTLTEDGVDQLPTMMKSEKEVEFVKSYTEISGAAPNNASAGKSGKISFPVSSFGPSVSVHFILGKKKDGSSSTSTETKSQ